MIQVDELLEVEIRNLFSYCSLDKPTVFDFRKAPGETRNLALVMGRNGYGKTSFINCLRLLFLGAEGDEGRRAVMRLSRDPGGTLLGPKAFIFGVTGQWEGIINRRALQLKEPLLASVTVTWREQDGEAWARRVWRITTSREYSESLEVQLPLEDEPLTGAEAQNALEQRLPARFMRFYIFDGEDMQHIAAGLSARSTDAHAGESDIVARLLGIDRVKSLMQLLEGEIKSIGLSARVKAHEQRVEEAKNAVEEAQQKLEENRRERAALEKECAELGRLVEELKEQVSELEADKDRRNRMKELREALPKRQRELREKGELLLKELIAFLPLWADPSLVNETFEQVKSSSNSGQLDGTKAAKIELIELLRANLPTELFNPPVKSLKPELVVELKSRLEHRLMAYVPTEHEEAGLWFHAMGGQDRQKVLSFLSPFTTSVSDASENVKQPGNQLRDWVKLRQQLTAMQQKLDELEQAGGQEHLREYETLVEERAEADHRRRAVEDKFLKLQSDAQLHKAVLEKMGLLQQAEENLRNAKIQSAQKEPAAEWLKFLTAYEEYFRRAQYEHLGRNMNRHWRVLMNSQQQIHSIAADQELRIRLRDEHGRPVGLKSLSEGMKQLMATAFLWALFDVTGNRFPIIIDTPLGRIDYGHQKTLLEQFYPRVARQVIVLPTDSELDEHKRAWVLPNTYCEYQLQNDGRSGTHLVRRS